MYVVKYIITKRNLFKEGLVLNIQITGNAPHNEAMAYVDYLQNKYNRKLESL